MLMITRVSPLSIFLKSLIERLGKAAEGAIADKDLSTEMLKDLRSQAKDSSAAAAKGRWHLTRARVITQDNMVRLREATEAKKVEEERKTEGRKIRKEAAISKASAGQNLSNVTEGLGQVFLESVSRLRANDPVVRKRRAFQWGS